jgi:hypothetical protein
MEYRTRHTPTLTPACVGVGRNTLLKSGSSTAPVIPELVSAVIGNTPQTDHKIVITFNVELNATIPIDDSTLTVLVNDVTRDCYTDGYTVSGFELFTSDGLPFSYGDIVTVSYTAPLENPLQSLTGGLVESFVDYPVTNNIEAP